MIYLLIFLIWLLCYPFACWMVFIALMTIKKKQAALHPNLRPIVKVLFVIGWVMNFVLNVLHGTLIFRDLPREWGFTGRMKRMHETRAGTWRDSRAVWFCTYMLNDYDEGHC